MSKLKEIAQSIIDAFNHLVCVKLPNQKALINGKLTLNIYKNGELIGTETHSNLIVNQGMAWVLARLANTSSNFVHHIRIGSSTVAPAVTDTTITGFSPDFTKTTTPVVTDNVCSYNFTLGTTEANGNTITEWGLYLDNNLLIARTIKTAIPKDNTISIAGTWEWSIYFNDQLTVNP